MSQSPRILLETCLISQFTYKNPSPQFITWIKNIPEDSLAISVATVFEIQKGIEKLRSANSPRVQAFKVWLDDLLATSIICLQQDIETARLHAKMVAVPALKCLWVPDPTARSPKYGQDLLIAATSIRYEIPIATINIRDFMAIHEHFSLPGLIDPSTSLWHIPPGLNSSSASQAELKFLT